MLCATVAPLGHVVKGYESAQISLCLTARVVIGGFSRPRGEGVTRESAKLLLRGFESRRGLQGTLFARQFVDTLAIVFAEIDLEIDGRDVA